MPTYKPISTTARSEISTIRDPSTNIEVSLDGQDWKKLPKLFKYLTARQGQGIKRDIAKAVRDFAEKYKKALVLGILSEGSGIGASWPPHAQRYSTWRRRKGAKGGLLHFTGTYLNALRRLQVKQKKYMIALQFVKGDLNRRPWKGGYTLGQYSMLLELGTPRMKARPLWQPAYRHIGGTRYLTKKVIGGVGRRLQRMGIKVQATVR